MTKSNGNKTTKKSLNLRDLLADFANIFIDHATNLKLIRKKPFKNLCDS